MILHLLTSRVFVEYAVEQFENTHKGRNIYYFIVSSEEQLKELSFGREVHVILWNSEAYEKLIRDIGQYDALVVHSLHPSLFPFVLNAPEKMPVAWIFFGNEIYNTFREFKTSMLLPASRRYLYGTLNYHLEQVKPLYRRLLGRKTNESYVKKCLKRIDFFSATMKKTHEYLLEEGLTDAVYFKFSYYSIEQSVGEDLMDKTIQGDSILLGNSASLSSNLLDALDSLSSNGIKGRKIYTTLSYGDKRLAGKVVKKGRSLFGEQFIPLLDFLPRDEYNRILLNCAFMIMNHLRPQGRGNIVAALWMGAKVFMNRENVMYQDFIENGLLVYPMTEIEEEKEGTFVRLTDEQVKHNRERLSKLFSYEVVLGMTRELVRVLDPVQVSDS